MSADYEPDYIPRECECGHNEHRGPCYRDKFIYVPRIGEGPEPGWRAMPTHKRAADAGLQMYAAPCRCSEFREYEGEQP